MKRKLKFALSLTVIFIIQSCSLLMAQDKFVYLTEFKGAYEENPNLSDLEQEYDLLKILLLDSTKASIFVSYDPELEELSKQHTEGMTLNRATVGFVTQIDKVSDAFREPERILNCLFGSNQKADGIYTIDRPVYIDGNDAIFEVSSPTTSDLYYMRYHEGVVQINWLGGVIY